MNGPQGKVGQWVSELLRAQTLLRGSLKEPACLLLIAAEPASPMQTGQLPDSIYSSLKREQEGFPNMWIPLRNDAATVDPLLHTGLFNL